MKKRMKYNGTFEVPCAYNGGGLLHERSHDISSKDYIYVPAKNVV